MKGFGFNEGKVQVLDYYYNGQEFVKWLAAN